MTPKLLFLSLPLLLSLLNIIKVEATGEAVRNERETQEHVSRRNNRIPTATADSNLDLHSASVSSTIDSSLTEIDYASTIVAEHGVFESATAGDNGAAARALKKKIKSKKPKKEKDPCTKKMEKKGLCCRQKTIKKGECDNIFGDPPTSTPTPAPTVQPSVSMGPSVSMEPSSVSMTWTCETFSYEAVKAYCEDLQARGLEPCCTNNQGVVFGPNTPTGNQYLPPCADWGDGCPASVTLGPGSCQGGGSCYRLRYNAPNAVIDIGENSCQGIFSCGNMGSFDENSPATDYDPVDPAVGDGSALVVRDNACQSDTACSNSGMYSGKTVEVGYGSCVNGRNICNYAGFYSVSGGLLIEDGSCLNGESACGFVGFGTGQVHVKSSSCHGRTACSNAGSYGTGDKGTTIGTGSCLGSAACSLLGYAWQVTEDVSVTALDGTCVADNACTGCARGVTGDIEITGTTTCEYTTNAP